MGNRFRPTDSTPGIDLVEAPVGSRFEVRQVAGLGAGRSVEIGPGRSIIDGGESRSGTPCGHLGFVVDLADDLAVGLEIMVEPLDRPLRLGDETIFGRSPLRGRVIDAGSARFVVRPAAITRPESARPLDRPDRIGIESPEAVGAEGTSSGDRLRLNDWVVDPVPCPRPVGNDLVELAAVRTRLHHGPCDTRARVEGRGDRRWLHRPGDPLFGTAMVGLVDMRVATDSSGGSVQVPVSVDLLGSDTIVIGTRRRQLGLVRHLVLAVAAAIAPHHLRIVVETDRPDLAPLTRLPHATRPPGGASDQTLLVIDQDARPDRHRTRRASAVRGLHRGPVSGVGACLIVGRPHDPVPDRADVVSIVDDQTVSVDCADPARLVRRAMPIGLADEVARSLVERLAV